MGMQKQSGMYLSSVSQCINLHLGERERMPSSEALLPPTALLRSHAQLPSALKETLLCTDPLPRAEHTAAASAPARVCCTPMCSGGWEQGEVIVLQLAAPPRSCMGCVLLAHSAAASPDSSSCPALLCRGAGSFTECLGKRGRNTKYFPLWCLDHLHSYLLSFHASPTRAQDLSLNHHLQKSLWLHVTGE